MCVRTQDALGSAYRDPVLGRVAFGSCSTPSRVELSECGLRAKPKLHLNSICASRLANDRHCERGRERGSRAEGSWPKSAILNGSQKLSSSLQHNFRRHCCCFVGAIKKLLQPQSIAAPPTTPLPHCPHPVAVDLILNADGAHRQALHCAAKCFYLYIFQSVCCSRQATRRVWGRGRG